jgi:putative spermidine/putrescine transport system permease protein
VSANAAYLRTPLHRLAGLLHRRSGLLLAILLGPPMIWMCVIYLGSLLALLWQGFYSFDDYSMSVLPQFTLKNYALIFAKGNFDIVLRTLAMAVSVTIGAAVIAFPIAYYMSRYATPAVKAFFYIGVMLPMWASYIVKAYSWSVILAKGGISTGVTQLHLCGCWMAGLAVHRRLDLPPHLGVSWCSPISGCLHGAAIQRRWTVPPNLQAAISRRRSARPFCHVIRRWRFRAWWLDDLHFARWAISSSDADALRLVHRHLCYVQQGAVGNIPMAAAFTVVPIVLISAIYLTIAKRLGARAL